MSEKPREIEPSQVRRPRAAAIRTAVAAILAAIPIVPEIVKIYGLDTIPWIAAAAAIAATTIRVLALPAVEKWIATYIPWLSAGGKNHD